MVVVAMLPHAEFGTNDHRAPYFKIAHNCFIETKCDTILDIFQFDHKYDFDVPPPYRSFVPIAEIRIDTLLNLEGHPKY